MSDPTAVTDPVVDQQQNPTPAPATTAPPVLTQSELSQGFLAHEKRLERVERHMATAESQLQYILKTLNELLTIAKEPTQFATMFPSATSATAGAVDPKDQLSKLLKVPLPPDFKGEREKLKPWLSAMERTYKVAESNPNCRSAVSYASLFLKDKVEVWWQSEVERTDDGECAGFSSFAELAQALKDFLEDPHTMERAMDKLKQLKQTGSVFNYASEFFSLLHRIPHRAEQDATYDFVQGLKGFHHQFVSQLKPTSLKEAREYALRADDTWLHNRNHSSSAATYYPKASSSASPMDLSVLSHSRGRSSTRGRSEVRGRTATPGPSYKASSRSRSGSRSSRSPSASFNALTVKELCTEPFKKLTPEDSKLLTSQRICTFCRKPNHTVHDCSKRARYNSTKHTSSSRQGK